MRQALLVAALAAIGGWVLSLTARGGSDEAAREAVHEVQSGYAPWMASRSVPVPEPLLFALQAGLGAGIVAYALRRLRPEN